MNRRRFLISIGAAFVSVALTTRLAKAEVVPELTEEERIAMIGRLYSEALARSILQTREAIVSELLLHGFVWTRTQTGGLPELINSRNLYTHKRYGKAQFYDVESKKLWEQAYEGSFKAIPVDDMSDSLRLSYESVRNPRPHVGYQQRLNRYGSLFRGRDTSG